MTQPDTVSLDAALTDLSELGFDVALVDGGPGTGWVRLGDWVENPRSLDAALRLAGARFHRPEPSAASGGWLVGDIAAAVAWPAATAMLTHQTVLVSSIADIHLPALDTPRRLAARIETPRSFVPASPGAVANGIIAALQPVVEAVHARTRRGRHALWGTITDMVAAAFHRVGDHLGQPSEARKHASTVIDASQTLVGGPNWHDIVWSSGTRHTRIRNICCLWYQTPGGDLCLTCPRITDQQRRDLLEQRSP